MSSTSASCATVPRGALSTSSVSESIVKINYKRSDKWTTSNDVKSSDKEDSVAGVAMRTSVATFRAPGGSINDLPTPTFKRQEEGDVKDSHAKKDKEDRKEAYSSTGQVFPKARSKVSTRVHRRDGRCPLCSFVLHDGNDFCSLFFYDHSTIRIYQVCFFVSPTHSYI